MEQVISKAKRKYSSLEEFLISSRLSVDGNVDYGSGASFPVRGREIEASILFADISRFSARTLALSPTETLIFVNDFFTWMTGPLMCRLGVVDKYIGDEVMVVFSNEFGSVDAFADALLAARWMIENDGRAFAPHIGIASGSVTVGYVGTSLNHDCSVFGAPASLAARCAADKTFGTGSTRIVFPARDWKYSSLREVFPPVASESHGDDDEDEDTGWRLHDPSMADLRNIGQVELRCIEWVLCRVTTGNASPEESAKRWLQQLRAKGAYSPARCRN